MKVTPHTRAAAFADQHGFPLDVRAALYAGQFFKEPPSTPLPIPDLPFWYRGPGARVIPLSEPGLWLPLSCAVAVDGTPADLTRSYGSGDWTPAYTNTAGTIVALALFVADSSAAAPGFGQITGVAYGTAGSEQAMTLVDQVTSFVDGALYVLPNAPTGAKQFKISRTGTADLIANAVSYAGTDTTAGAIEAHNKANNAGSPGTLSAAVTVVAANAWLVGLALGNSQYLIAGAAPTTVRQQNSTSSGTQRHDSLDSNGTVATGSRALEVDDQGSAAAKGIITASLIPAGGSGGGISIPVLMAQYRRRH